MNDVAYLAIIVVFFALAGLFVVACDRIIGADEEPLAGSPKVEPGRDKVAA